MFSRIARQLLSIVPQSMPTGKTAKTPKKGICSDPRLHQPRQKLSHLTVFDTFSISPGSHPLGLTRGNVKCLVLTTLVWRRREASAKK